MKKFLVSLMVTVLFLTGCGSKEEENNDFIYFFDNTTIRIKGYETRIIDEARALTDETNLDYYIYNNLKKEESREDLLTFEEVNKKINESHDEMYRLNQEIINRDPDYYYGSDEYREFDTKGRISKEDYIALAKPISEKFSITKEEAIEDVNVFEKCLRTYYGCYKVFGRENFVKANLNLVNWINSLDGDVSVYELGNKMYEEYDFIQDLHFRIAGHDRRPFGATELALDGYIYDNYYFLKDDKGYYLKDYTPKVYLTSVNGDTNLDSYLHYSIENSGELAYVISYKDLAKKEDKTAKIVLDGKEFIINMNQMNGLNMSQFGDNLEGAELVNDYPVLVSRISGTHWGSRPDWERHIELAKELKHEMFIKDARSHNGGSSGVLPGGFIEALIDGQKQDHEPRYKYDKHSYNDFDCKVAYPYNKRFDRDELLITLVDANNGSCGDEQVEYTRNFTNSMVIGEPTMGCLIGYGEPVVYLPNSGLFNNIGTHVWLRNGDRELPDGVGLTPDIWVKSIEALDKTTAMLKYYGVEASEHAKDIVRDNTYGHIDYRDSLEEKENKVETYTVKMVIKRTDEGFEFKERYLADGDWSIVKTVPLGTLKDIPGEYKLGDYEIVIKHNK